MADKQFIEAIKAAPENELLKVIGDVVKLELAGNSWVGKCPFPHGGTYASPVYEDTGSLHVYNDNSWFCYGCRRGSTKTRNMFGEDNYGNDVIAFRQELWRVDNGGTDAPFVEILQGLADRAGIAVPSRRSDARAMELHTKLIARSREYYQELRKRPDMWNYLLGRGITPASIAKYRFGVVPETDWNPMHRGRLSVGVTGIGSTPEKALQIGISYRRMDGEKRNKYVHQNGFDSSRNLFGATWAKDAIRREKWALVTEGFFDPIAAHQAGIINTVGTFGAQPTDDQIRVLRRWTERVAIWVEDDKGYEGAKMSLPSLLAEGFQVTWILASTGPQSLDIDEIALQIGAERLPQWIFERRVPAVLHLIETEFNNWQDSIYPTEWARFNAKVDALNRLAPILKAVRRPADQAAFAGLIEEKFRVPSSPLLRESDQVIRVVPPSAPVIQGVVVA